MDLGTLQGSTSAKKEGNAEHSLGDMLARGSAEHVVVEGTQSAVACVQTSVSSGCEGILPEVSKSCCVSGKGCDGDSTAFNGDVVAYPDTPHSSDNLPRNSLAHSTTPQLAAQSSATAANHASYQEGGPHPETGGGRRDTSLQCHGDRASSAPSGTQGHEGDGG